MAATYLGLSIQPHNDIELDGTNNLRFVSDAEAIGQHIRQRLKFYLGEWFLDTRIGLDWFGDVLGGSPERRSVAEAMIKREVLATPGVTGIAEIDIRVDRATRGLIVERLSVETVFDVITITA